MLDEVTLKLMRMMSQHFAGEGIALQIAKAAPLSYFGPVRQAVECAEDLRSMVESAVRYAQILSCHGVVSLLRVVARAAAGCPDG